MKSRMLAYLVNSLVLFALLVSPLASPAIAHPQANFTVTANTDVPDATPGDGVCETAAGNGMCTLRAAIMEANAHVGADTIIVPAATYNLTIPGADEDQSATGDLDVTDSLTITGAGSSTTIIDAVGLGDRVLELHYSAGTVTISGFTIQKGEVVSGGGGIFNRVDLTLENVRLYKNDTGGLGGAIYSLSPLTLKHVTIDGNTAFDGGGGIYAANRLDAEDTNILNNATQEVGGGLYAIFFVDLVRTNFVGNNAGTFGGNIFTSGALTMEDGDISNGSVTGPGGGIFIDGMTTTLTQVSITENQAARAGGIAISEGAKLSGSYLVLDSNTADFNGGAIYVMGGVLALDRSTLSENSADSGGAIFTSSNAEATISASSLISNTATNSGGGVFNSGSASLTGLTLKANHAETGGGVYNLGSLWIENSTLSGNSAEDNGGGIYDAGGIHIAIYNSTITDNLAGSDIMNPGGEGGGIYNTQLLVNMRNTILSGNRHRQLINFVDDDCYGVIQSGDYNLIGTLTNCIKTLATHDLIGEDPLLGELADNGGPTQTYALLEGSPAIDGGNPAGCKGVDDILLSYDQRGINRHLDGDQDGSALCDIGSFELSITAYLYLPLVVISP